MIISVSIYLQEMTTLSNLLCHRTILMFCCFYYRVVSGVSMDTYMHRNVQQQKMHNISTTECLLRANFKVRTLLPNVFDVKRMMWRRPWPPVFILISLIPLFLLPPYLNKETHSHSLRNLKLADQTFLKVKRKQNTGREFVIKKNRKF